MSFRQYLLEHSDTGAEKTTAAEWLKKLERRRDRVQTAPPELRVAHLTHSSCR